MNKDRIEGSTREAKGKVKETAGKMTDNEKLKNEGRADQIAGKIQNTAGKVKDSLDD